MTCEHAHLVSAYHDGELPVGQRGSVEKHVAECDECRAMLAELRAISAMVSASALRNMPAGLIEHLEENVDAANRDRGVLRIAGWLTTAAAAVLVLSLMLLPKIRGGATGPTVSMGDPASAGRTTLAWQTAALMPPTENHDDAAPEVELAQWMASDLSFGDRGVGGERQ